jgi:hypothetical protein
MSCSSENIVKPLQQCLFFNNEGLGYKNAPAQEQNLIRSSTYQKERIHWKASRKRPDDLKKTMGGSFGAAEKRTAGEPRKTVHIRHVVSLFRYCFQPRGPSQKRRLWKTRGTPMVSPPGLLCESSGHVHACVLRCSGSDNASQVRAASRHRQLCFLVLSNTLHDLHSIINWLGRIATIT